MVVAILAINCGRRIMFKDLEIKRIVIGVTLYIMVVLFLFANAVYS